MIEVIPAVLVKNFEELKEKLALYRGLSKVVQIDVCDGRFVNSITWPMNNHDAESLSKIIDEEEGMPYWTDLDYEFDLMIQDPQEQFDIFIQLGAKRIIFHANSTDNKNLKEFMESIDPYIRDNIEIGLAVKSDTDTKIVDDFINNIDFIQCMGVKDIGFQGQPFDEEVLKLINSLHKKYPEIPISVDGSVNEQTAQALIDNGASRLVIGSALLRTYDIKGKIFEFENLD